jgi:hypothetical protein
MAEEVIATLCAPVIGAVALTRSRNPWEFKSFYDPASCSCRPDPV